MSARHSGLTNELKRARLARSHFISRFAGVGCAARLGGSVLMEDGNYDKTERDKASEVVERLVVIRWVI